MMRGISVIRENEYGYDDDDDDDEVLIVSELLILLPKIFRLLPLQSILLPFHYYFQHYYLLF